MPHWPHTAGKGEVFSRCSLAADLPSLQHFHSYSPRSFAPLSKNNSLLSSVFRSARNDRSQKTCSKLSLTRRLT
ncbi:hypothetical protein OJAV_G00126690 [Oryzias javanicus]|uniref:Uncharacterized protein n=1 Tax=Oryzias javanicus TaxID=123683 RepID=A0A437CPH9_ORYJA|nr:hypothetical protein OJAV_G00126690 [Oryzias javanicus]